MCGPPSRGCSGEVDSQGGVVVVVHAASRAPSVVRVSARACTLSQRPARQSPGTHCRLPPHSRRRASSISPSPASRNSYRPATTRSIVRAPTSTARFSTTRGCLCLLLSAYPLRKCGARFCLLAVSSCRTCACARPSPSAPAHSAVPSSLLPCRHAQSSNP